MVAQSLKEKIWNHIDENSDDIINLCSDLVKIPSVNPPGDMIEIASYIGNYLKKHDVSYETFEPDKGKTSIVSKIGGKNGPNLVLNGHMDVIPAGDPDQWAFPPFSGQVKEGKILGRGTTDMKGGLAAALYAYVSLNALEVALPGTLQLALVPDEETGGRFGTAWLLQQRKVTGDAWIIAEPSGMWSTTIGQKGVCWLILEAKGKSAHGSLAPLVGKNAIVEMAKLIPALSKLWQMRSVAPEDVRGVVEDSKKYAERKLLNIRGAGKIFDHVSVNFGVIKGGTKVNVVADSCTLEVDARIPIGLTSKEVIKTAQKLIQETNITDVKVHVAVASEPNYTRLDESLVQILCKVSEEVNQTKTIPLLQWATSDARYPRLKGIPTLQYGPAIIEGIHSYNEAVNTKDVVNAAKVYAGTIIEYFYQSKTRMHFNAI